MRIASMVALAAVCLLLPTTPASAAPAQARLTQNFVRVPASIDATGREDVTAQLNAFLATVPPNSTVVFPKNARYRVEDTVEVNDAHRMVIRGRGALLFATTQGDKSRFHLSFQSGSDIIVRNLVIRGAHPAGGVEEEAYVEQLEAQHGIRIGGVQRIRITRTTVTDVYGDFVYIARDQRVDEPTYKTPASDVVIDRNTMSRNGRQGVAITHAARVLITRNKIDQVRRSTFDLEPNGADWTVRDVTIARNRIGVGRLNFLSAGGAGGAVDRVTVNDNTLVGDPMKFYIGDSRGSSRDSWTITGNTSDEPFGSRSIGVVVAKAVTSFVFRGNTQPFQANRNMVAVRMERACGYDIRDNSVPGAVGQYLSQDEVCGESARGAAADPTQRPQRPRLS